MMRASVEQQQDIIRYMGDLNDWFGRDRLDRQNEMRAILDSIAALRRQFPGGFPCTLIVFFGADCSLTTAYSWARHAGASPNWRWTSCRSHSPYVQSRWFRSWTISTWTIPTRVSARCRGRLARALYLHRN